MKKEIRVVDAKEGIVTITTPDERWYVKTDKQGESVYIPSITWICSYYPKGIAFYKWLASKGWDEAQAIKSAAGDKGSKVHRAITDLLEGAEVKMDAKYLNPTTEELEELTLEEYGCLMSFVSWFNEVHPKIIANELVVFNNDHDYAGTLDLVCQINDIDYIVDFKTGQNLWPEYNLQLSAYMHAYYKATPLAMPKLAILQLGYRRNKKGFKFTEIGDNFDLFRATQEIWASECSNIIPKQRNYPTELTLKRGG